MEKNFRITITKTVPNPKFAEEMVEREKVSVYNRKMYIDETFPPREITTDVLITEVSSEQFEKIRKAVLENF